MTAIYQVKIKSGQTNARVHSKKNGARPPIQCRKWSRFSMLYLFKLAKLSNFKKFVQVSTDFNTMGSFQIHAHKTKHKENNMPLVETTKLWMEEAAPRLGWGTFQFGLAFSELSLTTGDYILSPMFKCNGCVW